MFEKLPSGYRLTAAGEEVLELVFTEFVSRRLAAYAPLLAGLSLSRD